MPDRKPAVPQERHRRMASKWLRLSAGRMDRENALAQLIATVERDAFARGVEAMLDAALTDAKYDSKPSTVERLKKRLTTIRDVLLRDLLPEPPRTGPELAAEHGFPNLAESGAARVPGVGEPEKETDS